MPRSACSSSPPAASATPAGAGHPDPDPARRLDLLRPPLRRRVRQRLRDPARLHGRPDGAGTWSFADRRRRRPPVAHRRPPGAAGRAARSRSSSSPTSGTRCALAEAEAERESATPRTSPPPPAVGTQDVLVVLAQFSDQSLTDRAGRLVRPLLRPDHSVADYYDTASFGALDLAARPTETPGHGRRRGRDRHPADAPPRQRPGLRRLPRHARPILAGRRRLGRLRRLRHRQRRVPRPRRAPPGDRGGRAPRPPWLRRPVRLGPPRLVWTTRSPPTGSSSATTVHRRLLHRRRAPVRIGEGVFQATLGVWVHEFGHDLGPHRPLRHRRQLRRRRHVERHGPPLAGPARRAHRHPPAAARPLQPLAARAG